MQRIIRWLALVGYCALIFWLSDQPALPVPAVFDFQDKLIHAAAYAVMALLCWQAAVAHLPINLLAIVTAVFCALYGLSDEWHQSFVDGRDATVYDWLADCFGAFLLTIILWKREFMTGRVKPECE